MKFDKTRSSGALASEISRLYSAALQRTLLPWGCRLVSFRR